MTSTRLTMKTAWLGLCGLALLTSFSSAAEIRVEIFEGISSKKSWSLGSPRLVEDYPAGAFGLMDVRQKYSDKGLRADRSNPFLVRMTVKVKLPAGEQRLLLRSRNAARLWLDGKIIAETKFLNPNASGHEHVPALKSSDDRTLCPLPPGQRESLAEVKLDGAEHLLMVETIVGGKGLRAELGELVVAIAGKDGPFRLVSVDGSETPYTEDGWRDYSRKQQHWLASENTRRRRAAGAKESEYWKKRHAMTRQEIAARPAVEIPKVENNTAVNNSIDRFIAARLSAAGVKPAALTDDAAFLRRVSLDTVGVIPSRQEIAAFEKLSPGERRKKTIDRLLADPRWADHWVGYWQDLLAENPGILKPKLNNTGPFRWWIYESFLDNQPIDRFATELMMMQGSKLGGGPGGFAMATQNDAPMAAKAHVVAKAFLGIEMKCARCHDAPFQDVKQRDTFSLAAMLAGKPLAVPKSSVVPKTSPPRELSITSSLRAGETLQPLWPFEKIAPAKIAGGVLRDKSNSAERLAALVTSPSNDRFAKVIVNRLWKRYLGWGLVEPIDDWQDTEASHPRLLDWLARELVTHDYDLKHVARLILSSHTYQREVLAAGERLPSAKERLFASPARRRMSAEQLVDSLFVAAGKELGTERLCLDPEGRRPISSFLNLGVPRRAWQFTSLSNERDRPALALPRAQTIVDVLVTFGWRESRQDPISVRDETPTVLQPLIVANGVVGSRVTRLSDDSAVTALCLEDRSVESLVDAVYRQVLTRRPNAGEKQMFVELLRGGYDERRVKLANPQAAAGNKKKDGRTAVSWANHLSPEATRIKLELEKLARAGDPPTERLQADWRERMEDMLWALVNSPEFVFVP
jgi:hypothetical protein